VDELQRRGDGGHIAGGNIAFSIRNEMSAEVSHPFANNAKGWGTEHFSYG
jgi:hypothetical protein